MFPHGGAGVGGPTGRVPKWPRAFLQLPARPYTSLGEAQVLSGREGLNTEGAAGLARVARRLRVQPEVRGGTESLEVAEIRGRAARALGADRPSSGARVREAAARTLEKRRLASARHVRGLDEGLLGEMGDNQQRLPTLRGGGGPGKGSTDKGARATTFFPGG